MMLSSDRISRLNFKSLEARSQASAISLIPNLSQGYMGFSFPLLRGPKSSAVGFYSIEYELIRFLDFAPNNDSPDLLLNMAFKSVAWMVT
jgi:hypothetical protein